MPALLLLERTPAHHGGLLHTMARCCKKDEGYYE